jgi:hypothetical protein
MHHLLYNLDLDFRNFLHCHYLLNRGHLHNLLLHLARHNLFLPLDGNLGLRLLLRARTYNVLCFTLL